VLGEVEPGRRAARGRHKPGLPDPQGDGYTLVTAAGGAVDAATPAAAVGHARAHDLDELDLVPGDLPSREQ
jgi:hypothetical protein